MGIASGLPLISIDYSEQGRERKQIEKEYWESQRIFAEFKSKHEQFLREREEKERRLLYAIAEKLGIDVENI